MTVAVLCGLAACVAWGLGDFLGAKAARAVPPALAATAVQLVGAFAFAAAYPVLTPDPLAGVDLAGAGCAAAGGVLMALGLATFYQGLETGPVSIVTPVASAYPLVTTPIVIALFDARLSAAQLLAIGLILAGIVACSGVAEARRSELRLSRGVRFGLATFVLWGVAFALLDQGVDRIGWQTTTLIQTLAAPLALALVVGRTAELRRLPRGPLIVAVGLLLLGATVVFNVGLASSDSAGATVVVATSACHPVLTILLALRHFDERLRAVPLAGACAAVAGVVALAAA